ncbi:MAG: hypothetical protein PHG65_12830 [Kiritimatiellae bacterium]|nr:hypothetical protein [Kiritimatiellia bacterium]
MSEITMNRTFFRHGACGVLTAFVLLVLPVWQAAMPLALTQVPGQAEQCRADDASAGLLSLNNTRWPDGRQKHRLSGFAWLPPGHRPVVNRSDDGESFVFKESRSLACSILYPPAAPRAPPFVAFRM